MKFLKLFFALHLIFSSYKIFAHNNEENRISFSAEERVVLAPGMNYEKCFFLNKKQSLTYKFNASELLEFNIHYHYKNKIYYPVFPEVLKSSESVLIARYKEEYCMMWINRGNLIVELNYKSE